MNGVPWNACIVAHVAASLYAWRKVGVHTAYGHSAMNWFLHAALCNVSKIDHSACVMSVEMHLRHAAPEHASSKTTAALPHGSEHLLRPMLIAAWRN